MLTSPGTGTSLGKLEKSQGLGGGPVGFRLSRGKLDLGEKA